MKMILPLMVVFGLAASQAPAIERYQTMRMSCDDVQSTLEHDGAAILRWQSTDGSNLPRYDRYVSDVRFCSSNEITRYAHVPTRDDSACIVLRCEQADPFDRRIFIPY